MSLRAWFNKLSGGSTASKQQQSHFHDKENIHTAATSYDDGFIPGRFPATTSSQPASRIGESSKEAIHQPLGTTAAAASAVPVPPLPSFSTPGSSLAPHIAASAPAPKNRPVPPSNVRTKQQQPGKAPWNSSTTTTTSKKEEDIHKKVAFISPPPTPLPFGTEAAQKVPSTTTQQQLPLLTSTKPPPVKQPSIANIRRSSNETISSSSTTALKKTSTRQDETMGTRARSALGSSTTSASKQNSTPANINPRRTSASASHLPPPMSNSSFSTDTAATRTTMSPNLSSSGTSTHTSSPPQQTISPQMSDSMAAFPTGGLRSNSPFSQHSNGSFVGPTGSWSERADADLLVNLGPRERTRQEVLWEIVSSEERYVHDLQHLVETFINPLLPLPQIEASSPPVLPTLSSPPTTSPALSESTWGGRSTTPRIYSPLQPSSSMVGASSTDTVDHLPIASRFLSSSPLLNTSGSNFSGVPLSPTTASPAGVSPYGQQILRPTGLGLPSNVVSNTAAAGGGKRSHHQSLPPPPRSSDNNRTSSYTNPFGIKLKETPNSVLNQSTNNRSFSPLSAAGGFRSVSSQSRKLQKPLPHPKEQDDSDVIPEDLKEVFEVLRGGIYEGHLALSAALRRRYEDQYPLVRSLADVFTTHSYVLREYNIYVLHLSNALGIVDAALTSPSPSKSSIITHDTLKIDRLRAGFKELDEIAADKGESGLAISLSKPFQRLLKYPLLLQNLLYNTDPSTKEYEATIGMVEDVEAIVRSIEDEKVQMEERVKTRDILARIDGLEREKMLMAPKPTRILLDETLVRPPSDASKQRTTSNLGPRRPHVPPPKTQNNKEKKNFRRLSDILKGGKDGSEMWLVKFTDVTLLCQKVGTTSIPLASSTSSRSASLPELHGQTKYATTGRRGHTLTRPRNLYKFIKIEDWVLPSVVSPKHGVTSMDDINRTRSVHPPVGEVPLADGEDDNGEESDDSFDRKTTMSFNYWAGDKVEPTIETMNGRSSATPAARRRAPSSPPKNNTGHPRAASQTGLIRRSSAQDKFGKRVRTPEPSESARIASATRNRTAAEKKRVVTPASNQHSLS